MRTQWENTEFNIIFIGFFFTFFFGGGGNLKIADVVKKKQAVLTAEQSSGIHIGLTKVLQLWKIDHGDDFVKLA